MKKLMLIGLLFVAGCKLKGDTGQKGDPGPGRIVIYSGVVTSNDFLVTINENPNVIGIPSAPDRNGNISNEYEVRAYRLFPKNQKH